MNRLNSPEGKDLYYVGEYPNPIENRFHRPSCHYAKRSPSQQRSCSSRSPGSQATIRKQQLRGQHVYNFAPMQKNQGPLSELNFDERQLPHYVVPVLYIPQRIITNEELYASEIYDQDPASDELFQDEPPPAPGRLPSQERSYPRNGRDRVTPSRHRVSPYRHMNPHNQLTDSETDIYDKLMAKLYGMEQSEEEIAVENDFGDDYSASINNHQGQFPPDYVLEDVPNQVHEKEEEKSQYSNTTHSLCSENSSTSVASGYTKTRVKAPSIGQDYMVRNPTEPPLCTPSSSAYTVYPIKQTDYVFHTPVKDQMMENSGTHTKSTDMSYSRKQRYHEVAAKLPSRELPVEMQNPLISNLRMKSESKCTQTTGNTSSDTQTGDCSVRKKSYNYMQKAEKGPAKPKNKASTLTCSNADLTVIIERGSNEKVYTVLGSGSQYSKLQDPKFDKATECFATVDLLPVESRTLQPVEENVMTIPKPRTHHRSMSPHHLINLRTTFFNASVMSSPEVEGDFDFYLRFVKPLVLNLNEPNDRALAAAWVQKLRDENAGTEELRTDYLKLLLFVLQRKQLIGVFSENPNQYETLEKFPETNLHDVARELLEAEEDFRRQNLGGAAGDFPPYSTEHSADLLEYSAAQDIPHFGVHAYYAISNEPLSKWDRTEKAVFPRGAASTTERNIRCEVISRTSSATSEPTLDDKNAPSKDKSRNKKTKFKPRRDKSNISDDEDKPDDKSDDKGRSRLFEGGRTTTKKKTFGNEPPSAPLGSEVAKDKSREAPTWGSNLIGVSEQPVRESPTGSLADLSDEGSFSSESTICPSLPYRTPSPRKPDGGDPCMPCGTPRSGASPYSPMFPEGGADAFFLGSPPSFFEDTSLRDISPGQDEVAGNICMPCGTPKSQRTPYSPPFPEGEADQFFLGSPPSFLEEASLADMSPVKASTPTRRSPSPTGTAPGEVGQRQYDLDELKDLGLDASALESDVFKLDNLEDFDNQDEAEENRFDGEASIERRSIDDDLEAFDRMIAEYENDVVPPSPARSPQTRPSPQRSPSAEVQPFKKVIKKRRVVKKVELDPGRGSQPAPRTIKRFATRTSTGGANGPSAPCPATCRPSESSRFPASSLSRIPSAGFSRIPGPSTSRISGPSTSRIPGPSTSRIPAAGASRLPPPSGSRIPAPGPSRAPCPGSRIPARGRTGIPRPGGARIFTSVPMSAMPAAAGIPVTTPRSSPSPRRTGFPEGEEEPFFLEAPPSFLYESTLPSLRSYEEYPSWPARTPSPQRPCPGSSPGRPCPGDPAAPYPRRPYSGGPTAVYSGRPCPGASSQASGFNIDDAAVDREADEWNRKIAELEAKNAEDIALYGSPKSPEIASDSPITTLSVEAAQPNVQFAEENRRVPSPKVSQLTAVEVRGIAATTRFSVEEAEGAEIPENANTLMTAPAGAEDGGSPRRLPCPQSPCLSGVTEIADLSASSSPYRTPTADSGMDMAKSPTLHSPVRTFSVEAAQPMVSPKPSGRPSPGSAGKQQPYLNLEELKQLGLEASDLNTSVFNLEGLDNLDISEVSITSEIEYEFNVDDAAINREIAEWDRMIAELEAEHAEDIALYGQSPSRPSPSQKSPIVNFPDASRQSPARRSPARDAVIPFIASGSPAAQDIIDAVNRQHGHFPSPDRSPGWDFEEQERLAIATSSPVGTSRIKSPPGKSWQESAAQAIDTADKANKQLAQIRTPQSRVSGKSLDSFEEQERLLGANEDAGAVAPIHIPPELQNVQTAEDMANQQYQRLERAGLEDEYKQRYQQRRPDMPQTPPVFSKYAAVMGEEQREYHPSEFGETGEAEWQPGEQFFEGKRSPSPRRVDQRGREIKPCFPSKRQRENEQFFDDEEEPELMDIESEFETSSVRERSPAATDEDVGKMIHATERELAFKKDTIPAAGGLPVTTPRSSPSPRRTGRSIRMETEGGEYSFELPPFEDRDDGMYFESPPHGYYDSPGSPMSPTEADYLRTPHGLPKRAQFSPVKAPDFSDFYARQSMLKIMAKAQKQLREALAEPYAQDTTCYTQTSRQQRSFLGGSPSPQQEGLFKKDSNILDRSITEGLPSPLRPPTVVPGWTTPPRLKTPGRQPRYDFLPGPAENVRVRPGVRNIIGQEMPPSDMIYSPPQLSPRDIRPSPRQWSPRTPSPRTPSPRTPSPRTPSPRTPSPRTPSPRAAPPCSPLFKFAAEDDIFGIEEPPEEMFQSPRTPVKTPPRSPRTPTTPISPAESPFYLRMKLLQANEPPYYSKEEMVIRHGRSLCRSQLMPRRSAPPNLHRLREVASDYQEENVPFLAQVERARPFSKQTQRIRVASPDMETVHESPIKVPEFTQADHIAGIRRIVQEIEQQHPGSPEARAPPDNLMGAAVPIDWETSPGVLDRSITGGLPSPMRPPTVVPGWTTPPRLKGPKRSPRRPLLPGPAERIRYKPGARDIIGQEMEPSEMIYSPPQLSPGEYTPSRPPRTQPPPRAPSPRAPSPCAASLGAPCGGSPSIFDAAPVDDIFGDEAPPEYLFKSPRTPVRTPPRSPRTPATPISPAESPFHLRTRLLQANEPPYYSQEEMEIPQGKSVCRRQLIPRRSAPPDLHKIREVESDYQEENVPFLSQVEGATPFTKQTRRIRVAPPAMETVHERPMNVPEFTQADHIAGLKRIVQEIEHRHPASPETRPPPEDLMGSAAPTDWQASPGVLDRSITGGLPSPMTPPTVVPGWTTPPRLKGPKRPPRRPLLPGPAEYIRYTSGERDILGQEMPPSEMIYSPPQLSPGEYTLSKLPRTQLFPRAPSPRPPSPCAASPGAPCGGSPSIFDAAPVDDIFGDEAPPEDLFQSPRTPVRTPPCSPRTPPTPISSVESPFHLRTRLLQADEPPYYSREEMEIPQGRSVCRRQLIPRRSAPPDLHRLREVDNNYQEENVPFLSQVEGASPFSKQTQRIRVAPPAMETVHERPMNVPEFTQADHIAGLKRTVQEIQQRHPGSPETRTPPEDLMDAGGPVDWQASPGMLDRSIPGGLPSPIKPPTVVPGWTTPPQLKKQPKQPSPYEFQLIPGLKDVLFQEMPPPEMGYSPPGGSSPPSTSTICRPCSSPVKPHTAVASTSTSAGTSTSPQTPRRTPRDVFQQEPQFLAVEMPPDEFMPAYSPTSLEKSMRYVAEPFSPDDTVDSFEEHERSAARSPVENVPAAPRPAKAVSPTQQLRDMRRNVYEQYSQLDEPKIAASQYGSPEQLQEFEAMERVFALESPCGRAPCIPHSTPKLPQAAIDKQYADIYDTSLEDFEAIEKEILAQFQAEPKTRIAPPSKAVFDQVIQTGGEVNRQIAEMQRSPSWLERVEQKIRTVPDPHLPRPKPYSPQYGQVSPTWSPILPELVQYADQIEEEFVPEGVWGYQSPKSPSPSPKRRTVATRSPERPTVASSSYAQSNIFDVEPASADYLDQVLAPQMPRSPTSPPTSPPYIDDYYVPHTPPSPGSPHQFAEIVKSHEFTDRYYDKNRQLMSDTVRVKNRVMRLSRPKRPGVSPIKEGLREDSPLGPRYVPMEQLLPVDHFIEERERTEYDPDAPPLIDRAVPQIGLPIGMADPGLTFDSPPRSSRPVAPNRYGYVPPQYNQELAFQSPPEFYESPLRERDIFEEAEPDLLESTPPGRYGFSPPPLSPQGGPYDPYKGFTSRPISPCVPCSSRSTTRSPRRSPAIRSSHRNVSPQSPPISPGFYQSVIEHEYTDRFFDRDRPEAKDIVMSKNKMIQLQRQSQPPTLEDIEEYDEEYMPYASPDYRLPTPVYYGSPGRQYIRTPTRYIAAPDIANDYLWGQHYEVTVPNRTAFSGEGSPQMMDTSFIPSDLDESFIAENMSGFQWMG